MLQRIWAITQKELTLTLRDRGTLIIVLSIPLLQLLLFAYAIHTDVKHIPVVVADQSLDSSSRAYLDAMVQSAYFEIVSAVSGESDVVRAIDEGQARVGIVIPPNFATNVTQGDAQVLLVVDGSNSFTTLSAYNAANVIAQNYAVKLVLSNLAQSSNSSPSSPLTAHVEILYNPDLNDLWFLIPGMIGMLLQTQTIALTALAVVREREVGTMEQILVTPIRPLELMLGKTIPNLGIVVANMATIMLMGIVVFGVPFRGNLPLFTVLALVYSTCGLGLGLLISSISQNQRQAQQLVMMITFVGMFLSGFIFPRYAMPAILSTIGYIFPLTYFIPISRGIFTKGIGIEFLGGEVLAIVIFVVVILFFSARLFRQRLD
ncbi:MAG TPA: ABC transporter permease [Aggregatilineales bacterium]|nr:ABC transporter permease [Aggregatilineales bacterium]